MGNASFVAGKRKYLFCADQRGKVMLQPIIDLVTKKNLPFEFVLIKSDQTKISLWTHVYFCGPESFITSFTDAALKVGYPRTSIHYERFTQKKSMMRLLFKSKL